MRKYMSLLLYGAFLIAPSSLLVSIPIIYLDGLILPTTTRTITPLEKKTENTLVRAFQNQTPVVFLIPQYTDVTRLGCLATITSYAPAQNASECGIFTTTLFEAIQIYNADQKIVKIPVPGSVEGETEEEIPANSYIALKVSVQANKLASTHIEELFNVLHRKYKKPALRKELLEASGCNQCIQILVHALSLKIAPDKALEFLMQNYSIQGKLALLVKLIFEQNKSIQATPEASADAPAQFRDKLAELNLPEIQAAYFNETIDRFERAQQHPHEGPSLENYLKFALSLPWQDAASTAPEECDLEQVAKTLDEFQYGMDQVKDVILTHLALRQVCPAGVPLTLCLVGKPGTGKTSICSRIATALNKKLYRIGLAGSHTQSDIVGTSRTYQGAQEGKILRGLKTTGSASCVMLLDEIDKMGNENKWHGSPANALLHALDPEQNNEFFDDYLGTPINISKVLFLATANNEREIPQALRDRMIILHVPSYTASEKVNIAQSHIIPRLLSKMGLMTTKPTISDDVIRAIIHNYTFEDGLRGLTNQINLLLGRYARAYLRKEEITFTPENLELYLGKAHNNLAEFKRQAKEIEKYLHPAARTKLFKAIEQFDEVQERTPEHETLRAYISAFLSLPWAPPATASTDYDLSNIASEINKTHYGSEKVKDAVLDYLALKKNQTSGVSTTLCLVGPPGVGKTSIVHSIARAMGKKLSRVAMGGITSLHDIRGIDVAFKNAKMSMITQALKEAGTQDTIILLDEIDKIPNLSVANALLDVMDPSQNKEFYDEYLGTTVDLSRVLFVVTANEISEIPHPLLDRMNVVAMDGYSEKQKIQIAQQHIIPKLLTQNGLSGAPFLTPDILHFIILNYTHEMGVRQLTNRIKTILARYTRFLATDAPLIVNKESLSTLFGEKWNRDVNPTQDKVGVVNGLYASAAGGNIGSIQVAVIPGHGHFKPSGLLERMTVESSQAALEYIKANITYLAAQYADYSIPITARFLDNLDITLHMPRGTTKDGNSAGLAFCTALLSALTNRPVNHEYAMTGEIDLLGNALAIGGLDQKLEGARRNGIKYVFVPEENRSSIEALEELPQGLEIIFVSHVEEIFSRILMPALPLSEHSPLKINVPEVTPSQAKDVPVHANEENTAVA